jgi:hypothetical protein
MRFFLQSDAATMAPIGEAAEKRMRRTPACSGLKPAAVWYRSGMSTTEVTLTAPVIKVFMKRPMIALSWVNRQGKTGCTTLLGRLAYHWLARKSNHAAPEPQSGPTTRAVLQWRWEAASSRPVMSSVTPASVRNDPIKSKFRILLRGRRSRRPWYGNPLGMATKRTRPMTEAAGTLFGYLSHL